MRRLPQARYRDEPGQIAGTPQYCKKLISSRINWNDIWPASWLNQVELWCSKIERDLIARSVFTSVKDLARQIVRYIRQYAQRAKPIRWQYTDLRQRYPARFIFHKDSPLLEGTYTGHF